MLPEHWEIYKRGADGISWRVKAFLESEAVEIKTTKKVGGRSRKASVKDVHSLRHTFIYNALVSGVPLPIVQSVVGHVSPEMTRLYMDHAEAGRKKLEMSKLPILFE